MSDYPTWAQRKAWNNDGMDPDWRPSNDDPPPKEPVAECSRCGREYYNAMMKAWPDMDFSLVQKTLPEIFTNPHVTIPTDSVKRFNAQFKEVAEFAAWVCGVDVKKLCRADMAGYIMRKKQESSK